MTTIKGILPQESGGFEIERERPASNPYPVVHPALFWELFYRLWVGLFPLSFPLDLETAEERDTVFRTRLFQIGE